MLTQHTIDLILFLWSTFHDALFLGIWAIGIWIINHFHLRKYINKHATLEERIQTLEEKWASYKESVNEENVHKEDEQSS